MKASEYKISNEKFVLANSNRKLHDKELVTKPVGYFKDAFNRFARNKGAIVAAFIIGFLFLFAIFAPIFSQYTVQYNDAYYRFTAPKIFENANGFLDGTRKKEANEVTFIYNYMIGEETGHNVIANQEYTTFTAKDAKGNDVTMYKYLYDTYTSTGVVFKTGVTTEEYKDIQRYQDEHNVQVIYPITEKKLRPDETKNPMDAKDANYWYATKIKGGLTIPQVTFDDEGNAVYQNIYRKYTNGFDKYESKMRIEGETPLYDYARQTQNETWEIRVDYYEYYIYYHSEVLHDKVKKPYFIFGTTNYGQDIFTCLASGARFSFILSIIVALVNMIVGAIYGAIEGYYGGKIDLFMERFVDILSAVPFMIVITLLKFHMVHQSQILILFIAFFLTGWIGTASLVRMQFYRFKNQEYVLASRTLGAKDFRIMFKHIFPNSLGTIITSSILVIPGMIFSETSLSYLGIINLSTGKLTSVGTLLAQGQPYLVSYPHMILFPSVFISLLMLSFNLFGNGLRDAFNPSLRGTED